MTTLQKAQQKYQENLRNYYHHKDLYEEYYYEEDRSKVRITKNEIELITCRMNQAFDVCETLVYIFGGEVRDEN